LKLKPRFLFHANAAAIGGRIARPKDLPIDTVMAGLDNYKSYLSKGWM